MKPSATALSIGLSLVIPAYNEVNRLPRFLSTARTYLDNRFARYEVIVVDDGSVDELEATLRADFRGWTQLRLARHAVNLGKGAAVRTGILLATGSHILISDADGATPIQHEQSLRRVVDDGADYSLGVRSSMSAGVRPPLRRVASYVFSMLCRRLTGLNVRDTQCAFKMFRRHVAHTVFPECKSNGYVFDVEALLVCRRYGFKFEEVEVGFSDKPGSSVCVLRDSLDMMLGLVQLSVFDRLHYFKESSRCSRPSYCANTAGPADHAGSRLECAETSGSYEA